MGAMTNWRGTPVLFNIHGQGPNPVYPWWTSQKWPGLSRTSLCRDVYHYLPSFGWLDMPHLLMTMAVAWGMARYGLRSSPVDWLFRCERCSSASPELCGDMACHNLPRPRLPPLWHWVAPWTLHTLIIVSCMSQFLPPGVSIFSISIKGNKKFKHVRTRFRSMFSWTQPRSPIRVTSRIDSMLRGPGMVGGSHSAKARHTH